MWRAAVINVDNLQDRVSTEVTLATPPLVCIKMERGDRGCPIVHKIVNIFTSGGFHFTFFFSPFYHRSNLYLW